MRKVSKFNKSPRGKSTQDRKTNEPHRGDVDATVVVPHVDGELIHTVMVRMSQWLPEVPEVAALLHAAYGERAAEVSHLGIVASRKFIPTADVIGERAEKMLADALPKAFRKLQGLRVRLQFGDEFAYDGPPEHEQDVMSSVVFMYASWHATPMLYAGVMMHD